MAGSRVLGAGLARAGAAMLGVTPMTWEEAVGFYRKHGEWPSDLVDVEQPPWAQPKLTRELDIDRVMDLASAVDEHVQAYFEISDPEPAVVYEVLNAMATVLGGIFAGTGKDRDEVIAWFMRAATELTDEYEVTYGNLVSFPRKRKQLAKRRESDDE